jgi:hypothetical protein
LVHSGVVELMASLRTEMLSHWMAAGIHQCIFH